jgi:RNA polymerase sigma-70 factor, ECF subfamily
LVMESKGLVEFELLEACQRGEPAAFEELVRRTQRQVFTLAYHLTRDRGEAEDVAQEAYLRVFRSLGGFRRDARFETWLYRIVTNTAMTQLRRRGRFGVIVEETGDLPAPRQTERSPEDVVDREELKEALAELPPGLRVTVVLKEVYGLSCREIGEEIGLTEGAVKVRLHRARRRLKERIHGAERHAV